MQWKVIKGSSNIRRIKYDTDTSLLTIQFAHGGIYEYQGVSEDVYSQLCEAESVGKYFHANIKDKYNCRRL